MGKKKIIKMRIIVAVIISFISVIFIGYRVSLISAHKADEIIQSLATWQHALLLAGVILLMGVNWMLEVFKWRWLLKPRVDLSLKKATASVLSGVSLGAITPSRIGEFAGRIFYLPDRHKIFGTVASFTGGFSQNLITIISGLICMIIYLMMFQNSLFIQSPFLFYLVFILSIVVIILLLLIYLNLSYFLDKISHWKIMQKISDYLPHTNDWEGKDLGIILLLSFIRYSVFSFQFLMLLYVYGVDLPVEEQMVKIGVVFMLTSFIPSYAVSDMVNRGSVSMTIFNNPSLDLAVTAASITLWVINLAIPGLLGNIFLVKGSKEL